jgi:hypothetical protein
MIMMKRNLIILLYEKIFLWIYPSYPKELAKAVKGCKTLLDIGCGSNSPVRFFSGKIACTGIDAFKPSIKKAKIKESIKSIFLWISLR